MTKYRRAKARIKRDKIAYVQKHNQKYAKNDNFLSVISTQHFIEALIKCRKGVRWKGSVQIYSDKLLGNFAPKEVLIERSNRTRFQQSFTSKFLTFRT